MTEAPRGRVQNALARDSYSYIHLLLVAGIVLAAYGLKTVIGHTGEHLHDVQAFALLGGPAVYLVGLVSFRFRHVKTINAHRLGLAILLLALFPLATQVPALLAEAVVFVLLWAMIAFELRGYDERRDRLRNEFSVAQSD